MKENQPFDRNEEHKHEDDDQLRGSTMNEMIREVNGDPDMDLNELRDTNDDIAQDSHIGRDSHTNFESTGSISGATGGRTTGVQDMDDHVAGGRDLNRDSRESRGNLTPKAGTTGSDFDGQVAGS
ncbi:MAG TPA: hypothetical protein VM935_04910 [Chitinophagaceae bacterium]|jgi:hypothetical protein|nr:hypothetical protein [Chitinophagaceae bacterium]